MSEKEMRDALNEALEQRDQAVYFREKAEKERDQLIEALEVVERVLAVAMAKAKSMKRDFFAGQVDPNRLVSQDFIEALRDTGASASLIKAIEAENERRKARVTESTIEAIKAETERGKAGVKP